jgi:hypothetical protein
LLADGFRFYFTGSSTLLFTFPSRYSFTIGLVWYLALECGHPSFNREFAVSQFTQEHSRVVFGFCVHDFHVLWFTIPQDSAIQIQSHIEVLQPRSEDRFELFPVRSSLTKGISYDLFSSRYLDISVPQVIRRLIN